MSGERKRGRRPRARVKEDLLSLLQTVDDSKELLKKLEILANEITFDGLTPVWGPLLYARSATIFRSFILKHFTTYQMEPNWSTRAIDWHSPEARQLEDWLQQADSLNDVALCTRLYWWKLRSMSSGKAAGKAWLGLLLSRLRQASDRDQRRLELEKLDLNYWLDEETAIALYQIEPALAAPFILRHLPRD